MAINYKVVEDDQESRKSTSKLVGGGVGAIGESKEVDPWKLWERASESPNFTKQT